MPTSQGAALAEGLLADFWGRPAVRPETAAVLRPLALRLAEALLHAATKPGARRWHSVTDLQDHQQLGLLFVAEKLGYIRGVAPGVFERVQPTPGFLALAARHDISPTNAKSHFPAARGREGSAPNGPLCVREAFFSGSGIRIGEEIALDDGEPNTVRLSAEVIEFEKFLSCFEIAPYGTPSFRRTFFRIESETERWNRGGRIAACGSGNFQQANESARRRMTINGEEVVVDVVACGLTIAHALAGKSIDLSTDPYDFKGPPRAIVKAAIVETIGPRGFRNV